MKYYFLLPLLLALAMPISAQRTVRCLVLNHSYDPTRPEKLAKLTPLSGGNTVEQGSDAGIFELRLSGIPVGKPIELIVSKDGYQILGPNPTIFTYAMPADESDVVRIAIIKSSDFDSRKADYEKAIEKRIKQANAVLLDSVARLQSQGLNEDERAGLTRFIGQQNREIEDLRKSKDELAARLAQVDLDQASNFARQALQKFRDEGDLKAALALMSEEKLDEFWENMLNQEEKVQRARQQGVENYMIRARLLAADFQFSGAYKNYLDAVEKDSTDLDNLWEAAAFLHGQNQHQHALLMCTRALTLVQTDSERAGWLNGLGNLYHANNKMPEAGQALTEALSIYQQLASQNPDAFLPNVAAVLNNLGEFYRVNNEMLEAEKALSEALKIFRQLADKSPGTFLLEMATTLNSLGIFYYCNHKMLEAEKAYSESLSICRQLSGQNPDAFLYYVAMPLANLGNYYRDNQKMSEAEKAYLEVLDIYRQLADKNPDAFLHYVAATLNNLGLYYSDNQRMPEAEKAYIEALGIYRQLADRNPDVFLTEVAMALNCLGNYYSDNQRMPEAEKAYIEALNIFWKLANKNPNTFLHYVATTLNNIGMFYSTNLKMLEAEKVYTEAWNIYRQLADKNPDAFLPDVAITLNNLGILFSNNERMPDAEKAFTEALGIYRKFADQSPDAFLPDVAMTLNNFGEYYRRNNKMPEAEKASLEALGIYRKFADKNPDAFLPKVAATLNNLGLYHAKLKHNKQALKCYEEALKIWQEGQINRQGDAILGWMEVSGNILEVGDSARVAKDYEVLVWTYKLMAGSCDSLYKADLMASQFAMEQYGNLSWWALFSREYLLAERAARRCLELDPEQSWVYINMGHAHLLRSDVKKAKEAYLHLKGKKNDGGKDYKLVLEEDFQALEAEGITHKGMTEIRKWLEREW